LCGKLDVIKYLVEQCNANVEARSNYGTTALHAAILCGKLDAVKYLVEQCIANVEAQSND
jgi:ankyrin repeat protein